MGKIENLPLLDRPREKAIRYGIEILSDSELLAIIIASGTKNKSAIDIAHGLIFDGGGLKNLSLSNWHDLLAFEGINEITALKIASAFELGRRITKKEYESTEKIIDSAYLIDKYHSYFEPLEQEMLLVISLNKRKRIIKETFLYKGTSEEINVSIKEILKEVIQCGAFGFYLVHNHPNAAAEPSQLDIVLTSMLIKQAQKLGIKLFDHLILAKTEAYSFSSSELIFSQKKKDNL